MLRIDLTHYVSVLHDTKRVELGAALLQVQDGLM